MPYALWNVGKLRFMNDMKGQRWSSVAFLSDIVKDQLIVKKISVNTIELNDELFGGSQA